MNEFARHAGAVLTAFLAVTIQTSPLQAQPVDADTQALIDASLDLDAGTALARRQIGDGDLLGAAATLERVLIAHPDAAPPRLLYAGLLCRLDDRAGAEVELRLLQGQPLDEAGRAELAAACGPLPPAGQGSE